MYTFPEPLAYSPYPKHEKICREQYLCSMGEVHQFTLQDIQITGNTVWRSWGLAGGPYNDLYILDLTGVGTEQGVYYIGIIQGFYSRIPC